MDQEHHLTFGPFRLEMPQGRLWRGDQMIPLRPRSLAMLRLSGRACGPPGDESRGAAAGVGGHACRRERPAGLGARDSGGVGRRGGGAAVSRNRGRAGLSVSGRRRSGGAPPAHGRPPGGAPGRPRGLGGMVPAGGPRHPPARLRQWGSGGGEDDGGRDVPEPPGRRARAVDSAGPVRRARWGGGSRTCPSWKRWGAWGASPDRPRRAAAVCAAVAGATPRAGERAGARAAPGPPARDDTGPHAARAG